jgi:hypothetical protein
MTEVKDTLEIMRILKSTEPHGKCLIWTGAVGESGHPIYKPTGCPCTLVRRAVYRLGGRTLTARVPIANTCDERLCVNDAHLFQSTITKIAQKAAKRGVFSGVAKGMKISLAKRGTMKLTTAQASEIRNSTETGPVLAARYGVNRTLVDGIKRGTVWKDYSNPFAGLMR